MTATMRCRTGLAARSRHTAWMSASISMIMASSHTLKRMIRYWNAAMREMLVTGYMHNHMRMYWGKKLLEWSPSPEEGYATLMRLNNTYFLDGRDANSYANVGWVFGLHDRPWPARPIFGTVRYMNAAGLKRRTDVDAYVRRVVALTGEQTRG